MKLTALLAAVLMLAVANPASAQKQKASKKASVVQKVGALAIDRDNGFYYGFAYDQETREDAERVALRFAKEHGASDPSVVLVWSGEGCGAYRTVPDKVGTAYGWGVAATKEAADRIATAEALKRSRGQPVGNFVWGCNSRSAPVKVVYDAGPEIVPSVTIKDQVWAAQNAQVGYFRNGDVIPHTTDAEEFKKWMMANKPGSFCYTDENCAEHGKMYNAHALMDPRGIAPVGWRVPTKADFEKLLANLGGAGRAQAKLRVPEGWPEGSASADNASGFSALPGYQRWTGSKAYWEKQNRDLAQFWTSSIMKPGYIHHFMIEANRHESRAFIGNQDFGEALPIRFIKE
jgi:uncharacterized protein (TIGR02145 family)